MPKRSVGSGTRPYVGVREQHPYRERKEIGLICEDGAQALEATTGKTGQGCLGDCVPCVAAARIPIRIEIPKPSGDLGPVLVLDQLSGIALVRCLCLGHGGGRSATSTHPWPQACSR